MNKNLDKKSAERERVVNSSLAVFTNKDMHKKLKPFGRFFIFSLILIGSFAFTNSADAATYYWYGGTGNWSDYVTHWSTNSGNSPASPAPSNAPLPTDTVIFNANSGTGTMTLDQVSTTVAKFDATNTSVVIKDNGNTITVNGDILMSATAGRFTSTGSWIQGASGNISSPSVDMFKSLSIAGAGVTTTMTGNVWISSFLNVGSGTLYGSGKILYWQFITSNDPFSVFSNVTMGSPLGTFYPGIRANITQKAFTAPTNLGPIQLALNDYSLTATGDFNLGSSTLILQGYVVLPVNAGLHMGNSSLISTSYVDVGGSSNGNGRINFGTSQNHSLGGIKNTGIGTSYIFDMSSSTITVTGNTNFTNINVTPGTSTLIMTGTTSSLISAGQSLNNLTYNKTSGTLTLNDNTSINGDFSLTSGSINPGNTTVKMNGVGKILSLNNQTLKNLEVVGDIILGGDLTLLGNLVINSGAIINTSSSNYAVTVGGNWSNSGTYTGNSSLFTLNGTGDQLITGSNTFYQFTASAPNTNRILSFQNGTNQTISNALNLTGLNGNILSLRSDASPSQWSITPNGSRTVDFVDVQDSNNTVSATPVIASNSIDSGNNRNWTIQIPPLQVSAQSASSLGVTNATLNGNITFLGGSNVTERGFNLYEGNSCSGNLIQNPKDVGGNYDVGVFSQPVTGLIALTQYSYTAYAINGSEESISGCQNFTTNGDVYYILNGTRIWIRGSISNTKDIAQEYGITSSSYNHNMFFGSTKIIQKSTPNSITDYSSGVTISNPGDDITPINANSGYIMGNHGLNAPVVTSVGHDKTNEDIGSKWTDAGGANQYVLASISGNNLTFYAVQTRHSPWTNLTSVFGTVMTVVSGAVHTSDITITSQVMVQQHPITKNIVNRVLIDGSTEITNNGEGYADHVDLIEEFDLIDPSTINTSNNPFIWNDGLVWMHVKNTWRITSGVTTIHSEYSVVRPMNVGYLGIIQVSPISLPPSYDHQYFYIPKTKPVSGYDFTSPQLLDAAPSSQISFNSPNITDVNNPPDRQMILFKRDADTNYDIGFAFGFGPYGTTASVNRNCVSYGAGCWWIYTSKKTYPVMVGGIGEVNNVSYDAYAYRQWIDPTQYDIGKSVYWNNQNNRDLVYVDYHRSAVNDITTLPSKFIGKKVRVVESENIETPISIIPSDGNLILSTTNNNTYGFVVLELTDPQSTLPTASPVANSYNTTQSVTLSATGSSSIRYSTTEIPADCSSGTLYTTPISVSSSQTIHVRACNSFGNSTTASFVYIIDSEAPSNISASPLSGTYSSTQFISLTADGSTSIRYSTTEIPANCSSGTLYSTPIEISTSQTIYVRACDSLNNSSTASFSYMISSARHASSGSSVSSRFNNLISMGNLQAAEELKKEFPNQIPNQVIASPLSTPKTIITTLKLTVQRMKGEDVKTLQNYLNTKGYDSGIIDGIFGPKTKQAVIKFQLANGLKGDGIVGSKTKEMMK